MIGLVIWTRASDRAMIWTRASDRASDRTSNRGQDWYSLF